ncbi:WG repeat-containing protein [Micromonospora cathayae]|uniref:WG repeat-containing protein n=1 Tax=Micromonospora cathayae TaxID=3028804 RepID=A0ABY7ZNG7_9ACTN|nr:WG repeat-containing protein [Micromonospora sp. HUAS 3]WDZ84450.1 WG repeat-containing protein [Micromonospora sp. HUAS 3]
MSGYDRWRDPGEPSWMVEPTTEWHPQFPGQRYPGDIGIQQVTPRSSRGRATATGRAEVVPLVPVDPDGTYRGRRGWDDHGGDPDDHGHQTWYDRHGGSEQQHRGDARHSPTDPYARLADRTDRPRDPRPAGPPPPADPWRGGAPAPADTWHTPPGRPVDRDPGPEWEQGGRHGGRPRPETSGRTFPETGGRTFPETGGRSHSETGGRTYPEAGGRTTPAGHGRSYPPVSPAPAPGRGWISEPEEHRPAAGHHRHGVPEERPTSPAGRYGPRPHEPAPGRYREDDWAGQRPGTGWEVPRDPHTPADRYDHPTDSRPHRPQQPQSQSPNRPGPQPNRPGPQPNLPWPATRDTGPATQPWTGRRDDPQSVTSRHDEPQSWTGRRDEPQSWTGRHDDPQSWTGRSADPPTQPRRPADPAPPTHPTPPHQHVDRDDRTGTSPYQRWAPTPDSVHRQPGQWQPRPPESQWPAQPAETTGRDAYRPRPPSTRDDTTHAGPGWSTDADEHPRTHPQSGWAPDREEPTRHGTYRDQHPPTGRTGVPPRPATDWEFRPAAQYPVGPPLPDEDRLTADDFRPVDDFRPRGPRPPAEPATTAPPVEPAAPPVEPETTLAPAESAAKPVAPGTTAPPAEPAAPPVASDGAVPPAVPETTVPPAAQATAAVPPVPAGPPPVADDVTGPEGPAVPDDQGVHAAVRPRPGPENLAPQVPDVTGDDRAGQRHISPAADDTGPVVDLDRPGTVRDDDHPGPGPDAQDASPPDDQNADQPPVAVPVDPVTGRDTATSPAPAAPDGDPTVRAHGDPNAASDGNPTVTVVAEPTTDDGPVPGPDAEPTAAASTQVPTTKADDGPVSDADGLPRESEQAASGPDERPASGVEEPPTFGTDGPSTSEEHGSLTPGAEKSEPAPIVATWHEGLPVARVSPDGPTLADPPEVPTPAAASPFSGTVTLDWIPAAAAATEQVPQPVTSPTVPDDTSTEPAAEPVPVAVSDSLDGVGPPTVVAAHGEAPGPGPAAAPPSATAPSTPAPPVATPPTEQPPPSDEKPATAQPPPSDEKPATAQQPSTDEKSQVDGKPSAEGGPQADGKPSTEREPQAGQPAASEQPPGDADGPDVPPAGEPTPGGESAENLAVGPVTSGPLTSGGVEAGRSGLAGTRPEPAPQPSMAVTAQVSPAPSKPTPPDPTAVTAQVSPVPSEPSPPAPTAAGRVVPTPERSAAPVTIAADDPAGADAWFRPKQRAVPPSSEPTPEQDTRASGTPSEPLASATPTPPTSRPVSTPPAPPDFRPVSAPPAFPVSAPPARPVSGPPGQEAGSHQGGQVPGAPVPGADLPVRPWPGPAGAAQPDPEQLLTAYRWRLHPQTLREVVDDPDGLRTVRAGLTDKLDSAVDNRSRARLLSLRAVVSRLLGDLDDALDDGRLALTYAEATGELRRTALVQARLARVLQWRGEYAEADRLLARANSPELPDRLRATLHEHFARSCHEQGRLVEACQHFELALNLRRGEDRELIARTEVALDAVLARIERDGFGPLPRHRDEILQTDRPPVPSLDEESGHWGYADAAGELAVAARYAEVQPFREGVAWVRRPDVDGWELIDATGTTLIEPSYLAVRSFSDGLAWVSRDGSGGWLAVDTADRVVVAAAFDDVRPFRGGVAAVRVAGGWGAVDHSGQLVVPPRYDGFTTPLADGRYVDGFTEEGLAVVDLGGRRGVLDRSGRMLVPPTHSALVIHPVAFLVRDGAGRWGALDRRGDPLIEPAHGSRARVAAEIDRLLADANPLL